MGKTANRPATYDDLLKVPDHLVAEIIEGELYASPRPAGRHERAGGGIYSRLRSGFDDGAGPGGWWIAFEVELHLAADVIVPDVSGWRRERTPEYPIAGSAAVIVPDWICEVLSPSTGRYDRMKKLPSYATHGVAYAWLVDPLQQTIEAFQLADGRWSLLGVYGGDDAVRIEPFDAVEIPLATLWLPESRPA